jgi:(p)ppGpp synthase/HD superfamily hydrolase
MDILEMKPQIEAMDFAAGIHVGKRAGGDEEFSHQVWMALMATRALKRDVDLGVVLSTIFLHDTIEDHGVSKDTIAQKFGPEVAGHVVTMSKVRSGKRVPDEEYYAEIATSQVASLVKGFDRWHNLTTMSMGFSRDKRVAYVEETILYVLPMLRSARRLADAESSRSIAYEWLDMVICSTCSAAINCAKVVMTQDDQGGL